MSSTVRPSSVAGAYSSALRRLALFGPILPYRGGIAQYTTQLHRALTAQCDVRTLSFRRQYPKWLYPGATDTEPHAREHREPGAAYILDPMDPFTWRRAADQVVNDRAELAVLNWWTLFWAPPFAWISQRLRRSGIPTVLLCHNLFDHGARGLRRRVSERLLSEADGYLVHSSEQAELLRALHPRKPVLQRLHPIYEHFPETPGEVTKRGRLELLFFGFIRPYKGLDVLLEALSRLNDREVHLTVVGEPWGEASELARTVAPNVEFHLRYVDDAEAARFFARADVVVLPYRSASGSGVATLAYRYGKPVLATRVGGLRDVVVEGETGWLVEPSSPTALAEAIGELGRETAAACAPSIAAFRRENSWETMAREVLEFGTGLLGELRRGAPAANG